MKEQELTPQESMDIITSMIDRTRQRVAMPDLRISIMWATLSIIVAIAVFILLSVTKNAWFNILWFAIPAIGIPVNIILARKKEASAKMKTAIDSFSESIWKTVGAIGIILAIVCAIFNVAGYSGVWLAMLFYAFIIVGFGAAMTGVILKERSYIYGGVFGVTAGFGVVIATIAQIPLRFEWVIPLYIVSFLLMFFMPACVIRYKLNRNQK